MVNIMNKTMIILCAAVSAAFLAAGFITGWLVFSRNGSDTEENISKTSETGSAFESELIAPVVTAHPGSVYDPGTDIDVPVMTANWYSDYEKVHGIVTEAKTLSASYEDKADEAYEYVCGALSEAGALSRYLKYIDRISVTVSGAVYGAHDAESESPIGGGKGYKDIYTTGDYIVRTKSELIDACNKADAGQVIFIPSGVVIDISDIPKSVAGFSLSVHAGVIIASDRGYVREDGTVSTGAKIVTYSTEFKAIYLNRGARMTGLTIDGYDPDQHLMHHARAFSGANAPGSSVYYKLPTVSRYGIRIVGKGVEIDNCEISGFGYAAIMIDKDVKDAYVHHCYIHHNQLQGHGYGVEHYDGATSVVEYNLFNYNRHSIAATGAPVTGYIARYNVDMGDSLGHVFDIHGGANRGDGTTIAGTYCDIYNNTFLSDADPYLLRGTPQEYQNFHRNVCFKEYAEYNTARLVGVRVKVYDNIFGIEELKVKP